ncbi:MAG: hypothetical protein ABSG00_04550, partial [Terracidiphilus sp.]
MARNGKQAGTGISKEEGASQLRYYVKPVDALSTLDPVIPWPRVGSPVDRFLATENRCRSNKRAIQTIL